MSVIVKYADPKVPDREVMNGTAWSVDPFGNLNVLANAGSASLLTVSEKHWRSVELKPTEAPA